MICEILSVGTELLLGDVVDTNAAYLSQKMGELGICVYYRQTCGDNEERLIRSLSLALSRSDFILVTGGLGPTTDDITRDCCAKLLEMPLEKNKEVAEKLQGYFESRGRQMSENNLRQAMVPQGGIVLENDWGTAPGLWLEKNGKIVVLLPGVPREMKALFEHRVTPRLVKACGLTRYQIQLHFFGLAESAMDEKLKDLTAKANPSVALYVGRGEVALHITAFAETEAEGKALCEEAKAQVLARIGDYCYGEGDTNLEKTVVSLYSERGLTLATAESCTGGLVSQKITSVSGSSAVLELGVCSYSERIKETVLGVPAHILANGGVYSEACALAMARGVKNLGGSDVGIGITGVAGPVGGTEQNPVGTVYIAVSTEYGDRVERFFFGFHGAGREEIRQRTASQALFMAKEVLKTIKK